MVAHASRSKHRSRELRRRVVIRARMRSGAQWGDACILNVSSRGLLIQTSRKVPEGTMVELQRGDHLIMARVVWSEAGRSGLRAEERLQVEEILSVSQGRALELIAANGVIRERRKKRRRVEGDSRLRGRALEFLAIGAVAASLAVGALAMTEHALAEPLARASAALGG